MPYVYTFCHRGPRWGREQKRNLTIEARIELVRRYREGEGAPALAAAFGLSRRQVYRIAREGLSHAAGKAARQVVVTFRADQDEVAAFMQAGAATGMTTRSQAMRALVRMAGGFFEPLPGEFEALHDAAWIAGKRGQLLNQLARNTHRGQLRLTDADRDLLREAIATNRKLENILDDIVSHVRSRRGFMTAVALAEEKAQGERAAAEQRSREAADGKPCEDRWLNPV